MKTITRIPKLSDPTTCKAEFAQQLHYALAKVGAAYIPVSQAIYDSSLLRHLQSFFALNKSQKRSLAQQLISPWQGVFIGLGEEQLGDDQEDYKEVLDINLENGTYAQWINHLKAQRLQSDQPIALNDHIPNHQEIAKITEPLCQIFHVFQAQANHVLAAIEMLYQQPSNSLVNQHGKNSTLRLLHYPAAPHFKLDSIRLGAHQDYSGITLLWQDATGGLEILTPDGEWVAVNVPSGCIGVIIGEVTQRWSGDTLYAAPHRVRITNAQQLQKPRYSIAYFCETNADCIIQPGSLLDEINSEANEPIAIQAFLTQKYNQIFANLNF